MTIDGIRDIYSRTQPSDNGIELLLAAFDKESEGGQVLTTPFKQLNKMIGGGLRKGMLSIIAGPAGNGKSYWAYRLLMHLVNDGVKAVYLPLENKHEDTLKRIIASLVNSWVMTEATPEKSEQRKNIFNDRKMVDLFHKMEASIMQNPMRMLVDDNGEGYIPDTTYDDIIKLLKKRCSEIDFIIIDPVTKIDAAQGSARHFQEEKFIKQLKAIAESYDCHIMSVSHTGKRQKHKGSEVKLAVDDLSGSVAWSRFCQYVLLLDHHDEVEDDIINHIGAKLNGVSHQKTLKIAKVNEGKGKGVRIAFDFDNGAKMEELGVIIDESKTEKISDRESNERKLPINQRT